MTARCRRCGGSLVISIDPEDGSNVGECISCGELAAWEDVNGLEPEVVQLKRWHQGDDRMLLEMNGRGMSHTEIAYRLGRTPAAIRVRLSELQRDGTQDQQEDAVTPTMTDWRLTGKAELEALIARIMSVENDKAEAERILSALRQLDVPDLPELPWKAKVARGGAARRWTADQDALLTEMYHQGRPRSEIARTLNRPVSAVYKRAQILGLTEREAVPA